MKRRVSRLSSQFFRSLLILGTFSGGSCGFPAPAREVAPEVTAPPQPTEPRETLWKTPQRIVLIRHAEKINDQSPGLSISGCHRAFLLRNFFETWRDDVTEILAQQPSKAGGSLRPIETVAPFSASAGLAINNSFEKGQEHELAKSVLSNQKNFGKTLIIAWEHSAIIDLAAAFGVRLKAPFDQWPGAVYDQAWVLTFQPEGAGEPELSILAEQVLPTDISQDQSGIENWGKQEVPGSFPEREIPDEVLKACCPDDRSLQILARQRVLKPLTQSD